MVRTLRCPRDKMSVFLISNFSPRTGRSVVYPLSPNLGLRVRKVGRHDEKREPKKSCVFKTPVPFL